GGDAVLTIDVVSEHVPLSRFSRQVSLEAPELPESLPVLECFWQITLPRGQHLFSEADEFALDCHWTRTGVFWSRQSDLTTRMLENWIGARAPAGKSPEGSDGNVYLFGRAGNAERLSFRVMSLAGIVLVGAGIALFFGWILVTRPQTRHVLTLLGFGF